MRGLSLVFGAILLMVLAGCAAQSGQEPRSAMEQGPDRPVECGPELEGDAAMHFDLIEEMADQGRNRAVLAHLDALESIQVTVPAEVKLLRAHAHRRLGEGEAARALYEGLSEGCMAGEGLRGLGLLAAEGNDLKQAITQFRKALEHRPVDARLRNDLGYAFMLKGEYDSARQELETARELGGGGRTVSNLVLLALREGDYEQARALAEQAGMEPEEWQSLGREAQRWNQTQ